MSQVGYEMSQYKISGMICTGTKCPGTKCPYTQKTLLCYQSLPYDIPISLSSSHGYTDLQSLDVCGNVLTTPTTLHVFTISINHRFTLQSILWVKFKLFGSLNVSLLALKNARNLAFSIPKLALIWCEKQTDKTCTGQKEYSLLNKGRNIYTYLGNKCHLFQDAKGKS